MIYLGSDHGGFSLKEEMKQWLAEWNMNVEDMGALSLQEEDDYPDFAFVVAEEVVKDSENKGILLCRSGGGMGIAANKIKGVRAILIFNELSARKAREDDDANIAVFAADWINHQDAKEALQTFVTSMFSQRERCIRRLQKIEERECLNSIPASLYPVSDHVNHSSF